MNLIMFDVDGTLVESVSLTTDCYALAVQDEIGQDFSRNWGAFKNVTDAGVLREILETNNIQTDFFTIEDAVKHRYVNLIKDYLVKNPLPQIAGANNFLNLLKQQNNVQLAMATGAWREAALVKLDAAGIDYHDIPMATSNDHPARIDIMRLADTKTNHTSYVKRIYFGDGIWDKRACAELDYDFIAIGNAVEHPVRYANFSELNSEEFIASL